MGREQTPRDAAPRAGGLVDRCEDRVRRQEALIESLRRSDRHAEAEAAESTLRMLESTLAQLERNLRNVRE